MHFCLATDKRLTSIKVYFQYSKLSPQKEHFPDLICPIHVVIGLDAQTVLKF